MTETHKPLPVSGYTSQNEKNVQLVNTHKDMEERMLQHLDVLKNSTEIDQRWLAIGRTHLEQAFMCINRSVFRPQRIKLSPNEPTGGRQEVKSLDALPPGTVDMDDAPTMVHPSAGTAPTPVSSEPVKRVIPETIQTVFVYGKINGMPAKLYRVATYGDICHASGFHGQPTVVYTTNRAGGTVTGFLLPHDTVDLEDDFEIVVSKNPAT